MIQQNTTFLGVVHPGGGYDPRVQTRLRFLCTMHLPPSSYI